MENVEKKAIELLKEWMRKTYKTYASSRSKNGGQVFFYVSMDMSFSIVEDIMDGSGFHHPKAITVTYSEEEAITAYNAFAVHPLS